MTTTNPRRPWGNGRIPALNCGQCGRQMDDDATYNVLRDRTPVLALCWACFPWTDVTAKHHARCYPDCPYPGWHEMDPH